MDEVYGFDGKLDDKVPDLVKWFKAKPGRRLRMIGTAYTEIRSIQKIAALRAAGVPPSHAWAKPNDYTYWYTNPLYAQRGHAGATFAQTTPMSAVKFVSESKPTPPFVDNFTDRTKAGVVLEWNGKKERVAYMSMVEAASVIKGQVLQMALADLGVDPVRPIQSMAEFLRLIARLRLKNPDNQKDQNEKDKTFLFRHAWSVIGGENGYTSVGGGPSFPANDFVSYFRMCLVDGEFH